jgi:hypothetical protein
MRIKTKALKSWQLCCELGKGAPKGSCDFQRSRSISYLSPSQEWNFGLCRLSKPCPSEPYSQPPYLWWVWMFPLIYPFVTYICITMLYYFYLWYASVHMSTGALGGERCHTVLELQLHAVVSCSIWVLGQTWVLCKGSMSFELLVSLSPALCIINLKVLRTCKI